MARCVVTGATSFIGQHLVKDLIGRGHEVLALIRPASPLRDVFANTPNVQVVLGDIADTTAWRDAVGPAEWFFHLAWDGQGPQGRADSALQERNAHNAIACLKTAEALGCKGFLMAGSQAEYGVCYQETDEDAPCIPVLEYGKAKLAVCQEAVPLAETLGIRYYHARIFSIYGKGDHDRALVPTCIRTLCAGEEMRLSACTQSWNFMAVEEAASVIASLMFSGAESGVYNIASTDTRPLNEFVRAIHDACGGRGSLAFDAYEPPERPAHLRPCVQKLQAAIGEWEHLPFELQAKKMVQDYCREGETG